jgi:hypothetical protein
MTYSRRKTPTKRKTVRIKSVTNARLACELSRPSEVPPVRPGLKAITLICWQSRGDGGEEGGRDRHVAVITDWRRS